MSGERTGSASDVTQREFVGGQELFDRYTLIKILGRGGMGIVWLARDEELEREVALKFLPDLIIHDRALLDELKRETKRSLELTHKNIVRIYDFVHDERSACISMEYVDGETLSNLRAEKEQKVFEADELAPWTSQLCDALDYAHNHAKIIHRDLKPANLMVNQRGDLKVSDFGIARSLGDTVSRLTMEQGRSGTLVYMSPQQLDGERGTHLDDIYSLGATLYDLLTSKPPFYSGNIDRQVHERVAPPMTERRKELDIEPALVPPIWEKVVAACLAKDPTQRPQSAGEMAQQLHLAGAPTTMGISLQRRNRKALFVGGVAALALLALAGWYFGILKRPATPLSNAPPPQAATLPEKGIAVLPFENLSKDEENAFFASGVQDEILSNLAKIADLKVISRTSVMNYKDRAGRNLREIAKALGVAHVVEGSVQRVGGKVRVTAQLIDARSDAHVWADHYDRDLADVFAIQSEIAQQIAGQLRAKLSPEEKAAIDERPTADLKAYALYTEAKAIEVWDDQPQQNLLRKVALLEQATERDPKFVLAWCDLAKLKTDLAGFENREAHLAAAKKAAETAVQLRPDLGQSHLALAYYYQSNAAERERAYEELSIARRTLPNDALLFRILSHLDARRNRWDDSLAELQKAYALDPLNEEIQYHLSANYQFMRLYAEREKLEDEWAAKKVDEVDWYYMAYAQIKLDAGDPAAAQSFLAKVPDTFSPTSEIWVTRFNAALYLHDYDAASRVLAAIPAKMAEEMFDGQPPQSSADALLARARGDQQKAQAIYSALREKMTTKWAGPPQRDLDLAKAAELDAGSGRKDQAINEARRAVELRPIAQDSLVGPGRIRTLALVYAWTGESAFAIEQLEIIAKIPAGPSYGELRFDPTWDSLRGDPRFEKIVASLAPKK